MSDDEPVEVQEIRHSIDSLPEAAVPMSVVEVVEYLDEEGARRYVLRSAGTDSTAMVLGLLELAKTTVIEDSDFGDD